MTTKRNMSSNKGGIVPRIEASGAPPIKQTGDLAQISVGLTGAEITTIGLMGWKIAWKRGVVKSTTTDGNGYAGKLASVAEWSATANFAYVDGDPSQIAIRNAIVVLQSTSAKYNFFNAPALGRDSWEGTGILTGINLDTGSEKLFGMDITIEGDGPLYLVPQLAATVGVAPQPALVAQN